MDGSLLVAFWGVSLLFTLSPGADWAYAIASGLRPRGVVPAVSGMLTGHLSATLLVAVGLAAVLAASESAMTVLTLVGALYLLCLGVSALRSPGAGVPGPNNGGTEAAVPVGRGRLFAQGVGISLLNPKVVLLILALLPQFASREASWPTALQMTVLGVAHVLNCAVVYFAVGYGSSVVLTTRPGAARIVGVVSGVVMVGLGLVLVAEKVLSWTS